MICNKAACTSSSMWPWREGRGEETSRVIFTELIKGEAFILEHIWLFHGWTPHQGKSAPQELGHGNKGVWSQEGALALNTYEQNPMDSNGLCCAGPHTLTISYKHVYTCTRVSSNILCLLYRGRGCHLKPEFAIGMMSLPSQLAPGLLSLFPASLLTYQLSVSA